MTIIRHIETQEEWRGERVDGIAHPRNIGLLWDESQLAAIGLERYTPPPVEPVPVDPLTIPLTRVQFKAMLRIAGKYDAVLAAIDAIPDPMSKAVALTRFEETDVYHRSNPLFAMLAPAIGMSDEQINALWVQAQGIV